MSEEEEEKDYIKIGEHKLSFTEAFNIKRSVDDMISEWDYILKKEIPFDEKATQPKKMCMCSSNLIIPIDYFIDANGHVVMCGSCKFCGGYKEFTTYEMEYPFPFKDPPKWRGLFILNSTSENDTQTDMFI